MSAPRKNFSNRGRNNNRPYGNRQQTNYRTQIDFGVRGFFVTVDGGNMVEKSAVREVYNLFDTLIEQNSKPVDESKTESVVDASDELAAACADVKSASSQNNKGSQHRLRQIPTNVRNCLFFQTELPIVELYAAADKIVDNCQITNSCRFIARFIPVELTTGTELNHLMKDLERLIHYHFVETWKGTASPTYALEFKARNNDSLGQKDVLNLLDDLIQNFESGFTR
ncbi:hypothetical protein M3Y97_00098400 [Aphelenchoides bicaudatus]|nr:hypothetical protein M3Y97_00098400 [Aphelenchoides bicaudatus]